MSEKRYRVLREGISQRESPGGPIVACEVGAIIEVGDEMAESLMNDPEPFIEPATSRRKRGREEG